jgi:hypothetical protein
VRVARGLNRRLGVAEGLGFNPNQRGVWEDHARVRAVLVPVSLDGMTSGAPPSAAGGWRNGTGSGGEGEGAMGRKLAWARVLPRGLLTFFLFFFLFLFCFLLNFV